MSGIRASSGHFDEIDRPKKELVVVAVTYTGDRSTYQDNALRSQGNWPSNASFTPGITQIAIIPDQGLSWFERRNDFVVEYSQEAVAKAMLDQNYISPDVFGQSPNPQIQDIILDFFDMEYVPRNAEETRNHLAELAGVEDAGEEADANESFKSDLRDFTRAELKEVCRDLREDSDDIDLTSGKLDFVEYLGELDEETVRDALDEV